MEKTSKRRDIQSDRLITRKDFLKGVLAGVGATVALAGGVTLARGGLNYLVEPVGGKQVKVLPKFHEEMKVILLGTGAPIVGIQRSKPANVVMAGKQFFMVDCGAGVIQRLHMSGIPVPRISDIFFTHHHSDHNSGFVDLLLTGWIGGKDAPGRQTPAQIYGPTNTRQIIGKFLDAMQWDINIRAKHTGSPLEGMQVHYHEKNDGMVYDNDGIKVTAFTVDHGIVKPAIGYRFEYKGKVIVISGDTLPTENMIKYSENADILIHEAYSKTWMDRVMKKAPHGMKDLLTKIMNYHSSTDEAAEIAKKAKVKHLVFTHLIPDPTPVWYFEKLWAKGSSDIYNGKITVGRDLMQF